MEKELRPKESQFLFYTTPDGDVNIDVFFEGETVWLSQQLMAELFQTTKQNISLHIKNIFDEGELSKDSVVKDFLTTAADGKSYKTKYYNLDMIISVGYRIKSKVATHFRQWATRRLREFIIKGFVLDERRLKQGHHFGKDYFDELLYKIREIRASERRFYKKITDIYAECSIDYTKNAPITQEFYATVQNKLHWAITGQTAAEIMAARANAKKKNMGLTTWENAPKGKILKFDASIAKNYLHEIELKHLNLIVSMYLDYAELQAERHIPMTMKDWVSKLDAFLKFNDYEILDNPGKVSAEIAKQLTEKEYEKYRIIQDRAFESDFDRATKKYLKTGKKSPERKKKNLSP